MKRFGKIVEISIFLIVVVVFMACGTDAEIIQPEKDAALTERDTETSDEDQSVKDSDSDEEIPDQVIAPDEDTSSSQTITIATYNVKMFFDTVCDSGSCGSSDFEKLPEDLDFRLHVKSIAESIQKINADIILLQEVETKIALDALFEELSPMYENSYIGEQGYDASIDVAVMGIGEQGMIFKHGSKKIPLPNGGTTYFTREFMEVHYEIGGKEVIVFPAHFKSKSSDNPDKRLAEAMAAHDILVKATDENPDALIVMGGDLNDYPGSDPLNALSESGELLRVASELTGDDDATYYYNGPIAIDHIFHAVNASGEYIAGTAEVIKDGDTTYHLGESDHAALSADFKF